MLGLDHSYCKFLVSLVGNYVLGQVLPEMYRRNAEPVHQHLPALVNIMDTCETTDRVYFLQLMSAVAKKEPKVSRCTNCENN
jgi:hypothetical protein